MSRDNFRSSFRKAELSTRRPSLTEEFAMSIARRSRSISAYFAQVFAILAVPFSTPPLETRRFGFGTADTPLSVTEVAQLRACARPTPCIGTSARFVRRLIESTSWNPVHRPASFSDFPNHSSCSFEYETEVMSFSPDATARIRRKDNPGLVTSRKLKEIDDFDARIVCWPTSACADSMSWSRFRLSVPLRWRSWTSSATFPAFEASTDEIVQYILRSLSRQPDQ